MDIKTIYEDDNVLVIDKPAGLIVFPEGDRPGTDHGLSPKLKTLIDLLTEKYPKLKDIGSPPRYGIVHRLDKDTSGILLVAKNNQSLIFLQNQFINKKAGKKYIALVIGNIKDDTGVIHTLIGRSPANKTKQKAYPLSQVGPGKREAITEYKVIDHYKDYTLLKVKTKTGRRHQIRCHLAYLQHPVVGDKIYGFKNQPTPSGLTRQFLHARYLKIQLPNDQIKEFNSELPNDLQKVLSNLNQK